MKVKIDAAKLPPLPQEELDNRRVRNERLKAIGVNPYQFDGPDDNNPYRMEAMMLILRDEEIPMELYEKIREYDEKHRIRMES